MAECYDDLNPEGREELEKVLYEENGLSYKNFMEATKMRMPGLSFCIYEMLKEMYPNLKRSDLNVKADKLNKKVLSILNKKCYQGEESEGRE